MGLLLVVLVHKADIQERAGAKLLLQRTVTKGFARLHLIWADGGYNGVAVQGVGVETGGVAFRGRQATGGHEGLYGVSPTVGS